MAGTRPGMTQLLAYEFFRLGDPARNAGWQPDFLADLRGVGVAHLGKLRVVEHAEIVQLFLDRAAQTAHVLQAVGDAAGAGQRLEAGRRLLGWQLLDHRRNGSADIDAEITLRARDAVDRGLG